MKKHTPRIHKETNNINSGVKQVTRVTRNMNQSSEFSHDIYFKISPISLCVVALQVLSLSVKGQSSQPLTDNNEVLYRIYAAEPRIIPQTSLCLLWNQAAARYLIIL